MPAAVNEPAIDRRAEGPMDEPYARAEEGPNSAVCEAVHPCVQAAKHDAEHIPHYGGDREVVRRRRHRSIRIEGVRK